MAKFRTAYGARRRVSLSFPNDGLTKQCFAEECDMNRILAKYKKNPGLWEIDSQMAKKGLFADVSDVRDYRAALDIVNEAARMFEELPALTRRQFGNDPSEFLDFVQDPKNISKLVDMGLATIVDVPNPDSGDVSKPSGGSAPKKAKTPPEASMVPSED